MCILNQSYIFEKLSQEVNVLKFDNYNRLSKIRVFRILKKKKKKQSRNDL